MTMASKIEQILEVISGAAYIDAPMQDYHTARAVRNANRCGTTPARFGAMKKALRKYRIEVSNLGMGDIKIVNMETKKSYIAQS